MTLSALPPVSAALPAAAAPGAGDRPPSAAEADRLKVAAQFEAILVRQMIGPSLQSALGGGQGGGGVYSYLLTDVIANQLASGSGLGLGRIIAEQLTPRGTPAASTPDSP